MRFHIGDITATVSLEPEGQGWTRIVSPSSLASHLLAWHCGIALLSVLVASLIAASFASPRATSAGSELQETPWLAVLLTLAPSIPAHEFVHAVCYPDRGLSSATRFVAWPRKLRLGVFFEGSMTRSRWLVMRLAPLALLSFAPTVLLILTTGLPRNFTVETCLVLLLLVNSLGSGGDVLAATWLLLHIPRRARLAFVGGRAYWRPGPNEGRQSAA